MDRRSRLAPIVAAALALPAAVSAQGALGATDLERALLPLPPAQRAGATVMAHDGEDVRVVRQGEGEFICLADAPGDDRFQAVCYNKSLEPFMARGREQRKAGMSAMESIKARSEEIAAGTLVMPEYATLHQVLAGPGWDGDPTNAQHLTVIYVPFATADDLGLPAGNASGPWLMDPGTGHAHIMIMGSG